MIKGDLLYEGKAKTVFLTDDPGVLLVYFKDDATAGNGAKHDIIEGKGSTEFGIGQCAAGLIRTILADTESVVPLSAALQGEYGVQDVACGVPCRIDGSGIREIIELPLAHAERKAFEASITVLKQYTSLAQQYELELERRRNPK